MNADTPTTKSLATPQSTESNNRNTSHASSTILSPLFTNLLLSPPPHYTTTPHQTQLSPPPPPPPHSEKINRAIRSAEDQLDAAVDEVHDFISRGCPDSAPNGKGEMRSPDLSEYSDDLFSPMNGFNVRCSVGDDARRRMFDDGSCVGLDEDMSKLQIGTNDNSNVQAVESRANDVQDSDDESNESVLVVSKKSIGRRVIDEESSVESEINGDIDETESDREDGSQSEAGDTLKLQIGTNGNNKVQAAESRASDAQDSDDESRESVLIVSKKTFGRRVIDEESSVGSEISGDNDKIESDKEDDSQSEEVEPQLVIDNVFSELNIDSDSESDDSEKSPPTTVETSKEPSTEEDDIEQISGCGCWTIDKETKDLHLPPESGNWPRIRLQFGMYQKLYQHQRIGIQWMASLHRGEIKGGILADDMGMGKTMQTLVYLGSLMRAKTIHNALIVCPKSVVRNWEREANLIFKDIVPRFQVFSITSDVAKEKRMRQFKEAFCSTFKEPILTITTYGLVSSHITELNNIASRYSEWQWCYVVLDEGHCIKNPNTNVSKHVRILCHNKKTRRLLLTGTPIQNNLRELHSLFDWATSGKLLGSSKTFLNKYATPIEEGRQKNASAWEIKKAAEVNKSLQKVLQPYFLQRLKSSEFQNELPTKQELVVFVSLSKKQRTLYQRYLDGGMIKSVLSGETASPLTAISHLKQLCGHPSLTREDRHAVADDRDANALLEESAKLQVLFALIQRLKKAGNRALVFSQSTKMLDIIQKVFDGSFSYLRIDGQSAEKSRQKNVDYFNDKDSDIDCMLLSTKAAGVGLTLNGANRAIIYDPSWNPAEDAQAVDRCYRIGQSKNVTVYRMITAGTVEEKMYEKQVHKDGIKRVLLTEKNGGSTKRYFDHNELRDLFKLAPHDAPCSMLEKFNGQSTTTPSKPSFLSSHPNVVGVASHDILYSNVSGNEQSTVGLTSSATTTPFSRSPFKNSQNKSPTLGNVECIEVDEPQDLRRLGGGLNRSRENRENAKARRQLKDPSKDTSKETIGGESIAADVLCKANALVTNGEYAQAMDVLLRMLENKNELLQGKVKLEVHGHISFLASKLGWL